MKNTIRAVIFLVILYIIFSVIFKILWLAPTAITYFYKEPKNTLDIAYIGPSNAYLHFNTVLAYNLYGYTTAMVSADEEPFTMIENMIKETNKYQSPKLYVIDIFYSVRDANKYSMSAIRRTTDSMRFSKNRIDAINIGLQYKGDVNKKDYIDYYLSFLMYHNRWNNPKNLKSSDNKRFYKGFCLSTFNVKTKPVEKTVWNEEVTKIPDENIEILTNLINYIKQNNLNVLFVFPIRQYTQEQIAKTNYVIKFIQENGLEVINMNNVQELNNIDFETDLYNIEHLNIYGSTKYTLYFAKYLDEKYNLPDHRGDKKYSSWESEYVRLKKSFTELTGGQFEDLIFT